MNRHPVSHRKLQSVAIDESKPIAFQIVDYDLIGWTTPEHRFVGVIFNGFYCDFRLKQPSAVFVVARLALAVHEKDRYEAFAFLVCSNRTLQSYVWLVGIRNRWLNLTIHQGQPNRSATWEALPYSDLDLLFATGLTIASSFDDVMFIIGNAIIAPPSSIYSQCFYAWRDAKCQTHAGGHERLIVGRVDFVERIVFRYHPSGRASEFSAGFVQRRRAFVLQVSSLIRSRCWFDLCSLVFVRPSRGKFSNHIAIADAHILDKFVRAFGWTEQIVTDRQFEEIADIGYIIAQRHRIGVRNAEQWKRAQKIVPRQTHHWRGRYSQTWFRKRYPRINDLELIEIDRSALDVRADAKDPTDCCYMVIIIQDERPVARRSGALISRADIDSDRVGAGCRCSANNPSGLLLFNGFSQFGHFQLPRNIFCIKAPPEKSAEKNDRIS